MTPQILLEFTQSFCVLFFITYIFAKLNIVKNHLTTKPTQLREKLILALLFGTLGCVGSGIGIEFSGSLINTRVIGVAMGGLLGGPLVGVLSGLMAAAHRVFLVSAGPDTAVVCGVSMIVEGAFAGLLSRYVPRFRHLSSLATLTVILCELFRKVMLLLFIRPFDHAKLLVQNMTIPMLVINSLGVALFITYIEAVAREKDQVKARQSEMVLAMTEKIAASFRRGLVGENLADVVATIEENTEFTHILITDCSAPIHTNLSSEALEQLELPIRQLECLLAPDAGYCTLSAGGLHFIAAPLVDDGQMTGFLCLGKDMPPSVYDCKLADGLGRLFSTQLTMGNLEYQSALLKDAEIRILQAQINPHFLFNTMSAISSLCRTDPEKARHLIDRLADFYRKNLRITAQMVSLQDEIEHIEAYLEITRARFGPKINVEYDIDRAVSCYLPPLCLQPLVENSVKHGLLPRREGGHVAIRVKREQDHRKVCIQVEDDGCGFDPNRPGDGSSNYVGLRNVERRLRNCFGGELSWRVDTEPQRGTRVSIVIPAVSGA